MNRHLYRFPMALLRQLLAITTVVCLIWPVQANAASKIAIMVGGSTKLIYLPAKLAEQLGYFRQEGLEVEFQNQLAGVDAENELLAGAVQAVVGFYDHTIDLQSRGKDITSIVLLCQVPGEVVLVARHASGWIKSMKDIKGRTMGVTGLGASTNFLTQYLASRQGIASNQYSLVPVGADNTFIAAMKQGRIDAGMTTEPTVSQMLKTGEASILVDMRSADGTRKALGGLYPAASLYVQTNWLHAHREEASKLARAMVRALKFIQTHSAADIAAHMPADYVGNNQALYVQALQNSLSMYSADGRMAVGGPETVLSVLTAFNPNVKGKHIDLQRTFTNEFVNLANPSR